MTLLRSLATAALLCALSACSGGAPSEGGSTQSQLAGFDEALAGALRGSAPAAPPQLVILDEPPAAEAPRLVIAAAPTTTPPALLAVELPARGASARLVPSGQNGDVTTWRSADAVSLSLRAPGVLIATRGLSPDLHIADAGATAAALARGTPGRTGRQHRWLDGNLVPQVTDYSCDLVLAGRERIETAGRHRDTLRFEERCTDGGQESFVNIYWRDPARPIVWQSVQWVGEELGALRMTRLGN
jgi:hypothetical protein